MEDKLPNKCKHGGVAMKQIKIQIKATQKREKKGHYVLIRETVKQKNIAIINFYPPNIDTSNFIK